MPYIFVVFFSIVAFASQLHGQSAETLLREAAETLRSAQTLHLEITTEREILSETHRSWTRSREVIAKDGPSRLRYELEDSSGSLVSVTDGTRLWRAAPDTREFVQGPANAPQDNAGPIAAAAVRRAQLALNFQASRLTDRLLRAEQTGTETVEVNGHSFPCLVIRADYSPHPAAIGIDAWSQTFWIDPQRKLVLKSENTSRGHQFPAQPYLETTSRQAARYTVATINEPLPPSVFQYHPPPLYREVSRLERPFPRPAKELIGQPAPAIGLPDYTGKVVLLDFWATWCEPCRAQMPALARLYEEFRPQGVVLHGIDDDESPETARAYLAAQGYTWPTLHDGKSAGTARAKFKVQSIPTLVVIDRSGKIVAYEIGASPAAEAAIRTALQRAIGAKKN